MSERERRLALEVNGEQLAHTRAIAQWVRLSGSEEELQAFRYIQGVLDGYGYQTKLYLALLLVRPQPWAVRRVGAEDQGVLHTR